MPIDFNDMLFQCEFDTEIIKLQAKKKIADKDYFLETLDEMEHRAACHVLGRAKFYAWLERIQQEPLDAQYS